MTGIEINPSACEKLRATGCTVNEGSILDSEPPSVFDLVFTKGVLIHIAPDHLASVYGKLAAASSRYIVIAEYYSPSPEQIAYRGHSDKLFKRDFAGEFLDQCPEFELVTTGFAYHRAELPQDDLTWFLLERR